MVTVDVTEDIDLDDVGDSPLEKEKHLSLNSNQVMDLYKYYTNPTRQCILHAYCSISKRDEDVCESKVIFSVYSMASTKGNGMWITHSREYKFTYTDL